MSKSFKVCQFVAALLILSVSTVSVSLADSWAPYKDVRVVDPTGRYYVVVKKGNAWLELEDRGGGWTAPVNYWFAERPNRSPELRPLPNVPDDFPIDRDDLARVRKGDVVHGRGILPAPPLRILVSSQGWGFVALDVYGYSSTRGRVPTAMIIVGKDGRVKHRKALVDLFSDGIIQRFLTTTNSIWWIRAAWLDEKRECVVIVANTYISAEEAIIGDEKAYQYFTVSVKTGQPSRSSDREIGRAIKDETPGGIKQALDVVRELKLASHRAAVERLLMDDSQSLDIHAYAAVALKALGGMPLASVLERAAAAQHLNLADREFAIRHLAKWKRVGSLPFLHKLAQDESLLESEALISSLVDIGKKEALPTIKRMLTDTKKPAAQYTALATLGRLNLDDDVLFNALREKLSDQTSVRGVQLQDKAISVLGTLGESARPAMPVLQKIARQNGIRWDPTCPFGHPPEIPAAQSRYRRWKYRNIATAIEMIQSKQK